MSTQWIPEILYEETDEGPSNIPFVMVPDDEEMPLLLYIFESRDTGEFEPGLEGNEVPVVQWDLHQYADMASLKDGLDPETYDRVRTCLGLEPLLNASLKGSRITNAIREKLNTDDG